MHRPTFGRPRVQDLQFSSHPHPRAGDASLLRAPCAATEGVVMPAVQHDPTPLAPAAPRLRWLRWVLIGVVAAVVLGAALFWGVPFLRDYLTTASTDDAYVNSHATTVAPRVEDNVTEVRVDNGHFVNPGDVLVRLDPTPYQVVVDQKRAALDVTRAQLDQTYAKVRSQEA